MTRPMLVAATLLAIFATLGAALVTFTQQRTAPRIAANERAALLAQLHALIPAHSVNNDILVDVRELHDKVNLGAEKTLIYRGRHDAKPVAVAFAPVVAQGYSGPIKLLVAVNYNGTLAGVRVISHKETPGLGDKVELSKSDWIRSFEGTHLGKPPLARWKVKRDGGDFDQFTGATITPRAVVAAVLKVLRYYESRREQLYLPPEPREKQP